MGGEAMTTKDQPPKDRKPTNPEDTKPVGTIEDRRGRVVEVYEVVRRGS